MPFGIPIVGAGVISAIGNGMHRTLESLLEKRSGIGPVRYLTTEHGDLPCGEVPLSNAELKELAGIPQDRIVPRTALLGIQALHEALGTAGLSREDISKAAFISGTTVGGIDITEDRFLDYLSGKGDPSLILLHDCRGTTDATSAPFGDFAFSTTISTACSSAANAIIYGADLIRAGLFDIVVAGGAECLSRYHLNGFNSLMILDREKCRPFDETRNGLNLGEGAGYVVLESPSHAEKRGAKPLAFLSGYGNACDAFHQTASSPEGDGAFLAMKEALQTAGLTPSDIDYVNAHGTSTPNNDASESAALRRIFGDNMPPVSSTKGYTGHTTSASGSIEAVFCILAMREGFLPVNIGWKTPFEGGIVPVHEDSRGVRIGHVLCNAFGFGGNDSSLLLSSVETMK